MCTWTSVRLTSLSLSVSKFADFHYVEGFWRYGKFAAFCIISASVIDCCRFLSNKDSSFLRFNLEEEVLGECYDYVEVTDGEYIKDKVVFGFQCGQMNRRLVRTYKRKAYLIFVTDEFTTDTGFEVQYQQITNDCGQTLISNMETKTFNCELATSGHNTKCLWEVTSDAAYSNYYVHVINCVYHKWSTSFLLDRAIKLLVKV